MDWDEIRFSGKNGMWMVVAGICFWGLALETEEERLMSLPWQDTLSDVNWVLNELNRTHSSFSSTDHSADPIPTPTPSVPNIDRVQRTRKVSAKAIGSVTQGDGLHPPNDRGQRTRRPSTKAMSSAMEGDQANVSHERVQRTRKPSARAMGLEGNETLTTHTSKRKSGADGATNTRPTKRYVFHPPYFIEPTLTTPNSQNPNFPLIGFYQR